MKKIFLSFADARLRESALRIKRQAVSLGVYDKVFIADESWLDADFRNRYKSKLIPGSRGYGYWIWKPQIILQILQKMNAEDILQYTDVGCHLNLKGKGRLFEYFDLTNVSKTGILAFQAKPPTGPLSYDGRPLLELLDFQWTKGDLLDYFGVRTNQEILATPTIGAGIVFMKKTDFAVHLVEDWAAVADHDFSLIDDTPSRSQNISGFIEHRHDQAIFSLLCKLNKVETLSAYEYWYPSRDDRYCPDWQSLENFPIHARRDKVFRDRPGWFKALLKTIRA